MFSGRGEDGFHPFFFDLLVALFLLALLVLSKPSIRLHVFLSSIATLTQPVMSAIGPVTTTAAIPAFSNSSWGRSPMRVQ